MMLDDKLLAAIRAHAAAEAPRECCGLLVAQHGVMARYIPCKNINPGHRDRFAISAEQWAEAEDLGRVLAVCHSHVNEAPRPSQADLIGCERSGIPWVIVNHPVGTWQVIEPSGYLAPYVGRRFVHGVCDCYSLVRDWYMRERGLDLPDYNRPDNWWDNGLDLYQDHLAECGFVRVADDAELHVGDAYLLTIRSRKPNHAAIYVGDGKILHHPPNRLSGLDVYGGMWRKLTMYRVRHVEGQ